MSNVWIRDVFLHGHHHVLPPQNDGATKTATWRLAFGEFQPADIWGKFFLSRRIFILDTINCNCLHGYYQTFFWPVIMFYLLKTTAQEKLQSAVL